MHSTHRVWRHFLAIIALVAFALPMAVSTAGTPSAHAQTSTPNNSIANVGTALPAVAINPVGSSHTVTFTCTDAQATGVTFAAAPGCYGVTVSITDEMTSSSVSSGVTVTCGGTALPSILNGVCALGSTTTAPPAGCPTVGAAPGTPSVFNPATGFCEVATSTTVTSSACSTAGGTVVNGGATCRITVPTADQESVTFTGTTPNAFAIVFTGYVPAYCPAGAGACGTTTPTAGYTCPAGTTGSPVTLTTAGVVGCAFTVTAEKKYVEITKVVVVSTACSTGTLVYAEGLKSYFGPACPIIAVAVGETTIKTGVDCATESNLIGTNAPTNEFAAYTPPNGAATIQPTYNCVNGNLIIENIPVLNVPLTYTISGPGSFASVGTLGSSCAGSAAGSFTGTSGVSASLCPTGPGTGTVQVCIASTINTQPPVCSSSVSFNYTLNASRTVPYVRWAGEKVVLTKCFGAGFNGAAVEFTLQGSNPGLDATLLPYDAVTSLNAVPNSTTIWATADADGCATVIGYADGEGVMYVDAAIYNTNSSSLGGNFAAPLVNEHAFEVFYLKFDHLDLENVGTGSNPYTTYTTATALTPFFSTFLTGTAPFVATGSAATAGSVATLPASFKLPAAPGTGQLAGTSAAVPLCATQFVRAMVHGYFEIPGDPSGRPASVVAVPGAPSSGAANYSYTLPAGRWVLPEDWPVLASFAGFSSSGTLNNFTPSSVLAWDLNSGWALGATNESPVICTGGVSLRYYQSSSGNSQAGPNAAYAGAIASSDVETGPCFGQDATLKALGSAYFYESAPNANCTYIFSDRTVVGQTVGIGPFDPAQSCLSAFSAPGTAASPIFPLANNPAGSSVIGTTVGECGGAAVPCLIPTGPNSTYLPNGTLSQWDAPMPPAQISFGITSGPGYLGQVNKTGFYKINFDIGTVPSGGCPAGYAPNTATNTCQFAVYPDPFYAEAIPSSPLIPPVTNNGGYLWDSWNFSAGTTTSVTGAAVFGAPAGGFVPGESTTATLGGGTVVPGGYTLSNFGTTTTITTDDTTNTPCAVGAAPNNAPGSQVTVANGSGFLPGMTVEGYAYTANQTGAFEFGQNHGSVVPLTITSVYPNPQPGFPNAATLTFDAAAVNADVVNCLGAGTLVVVAEQFGLPVNNTSVFANSSGSVAIIAHGIVQIAPLAMVNGSALVDTTANIVYVNTTDAIATAFGACAISHTGGPSYAPNCEPADLVPQGSIIETAAPATSNGGVITAGGRIIASPANPYPFWQWVPGAPAAGAQPTSATVYSDNHGEAVVTLNSTVSALTTAPVNGACATGYSLLANAPGGATCLYNYTGLGGSGFTNVASALSGFSASKPGCIQTYPSGTTTTVPVASISATGPAAGQICVNALGGIEFGQSATLGSTTVQAIADYPYTRGEHPPIASAPLVKVFTSAFAKSVTVSAGTPGPAGTTSYTVTVTATDVCGNPITAEPVEVYALGNSSAIVLAPTTGTVLSAGSTSAVVGVDPNTGTATLSLEVLNSAIGNQGLVIKAVWPFERIERFATVISGTPQGQQTTVTYAPGWQQIGGPTGSNFSVAEAVFSWDPVAGAYTNATAAAGNLSSAAPGCTGYWAYFAAAMAVTLPANSTSGQTASCTLKAGWNLVGNPFGTPATLPSGTTAYFWNGTSYDNVGVIGVGRSVWVYNDGTLNTLTLTAT